MFGIGTLRLPAFSGKLPATIWETHERTGQIMSDASRIPVIVGVGEITDKPANPADGLEPLALMAEALKRAEQDAGAKLVSEIDSILSRRLNFMRPRGPIGGPNVRAFVTENAFVASRAGAGFSAALALRRPRQ